MHKELDLDGTPLAQQRVDAKLDKLEKTDKSESAQRVVLKFGDARTGILVGFTPDNEPLIDFDGNPTLAPLRARTCTEILPSDLGREAVLLFNEGDCAMPMIMGLLRRETEPRIDAIDAPVVSAQVEADDAHVVVTAREKLTLRCGLASITLTRDGRVIIAGTHVQSSAQNTNRIMGGSVQIN